MRRRRLHLPASARWRPSDEMTSNTTAPVEIIRRRLFGFQDARPDRFAMANSSGRLRWWSVHSTRSTSRAIGWISAI